ASFFAILASQLSGVTGGEDGITFKVPELLRPAFRLFDVPLLGAVVGGRFITYFVVLGVSLALFLALLRVVNSPFGRVLLAIRENDFRTEALGYRTVIYRTLAKCLGALVATLAGVLMHCGCGTPGRIRRLSGALTRLPLLADLFHPDRWLLWLGVLFCVVGVLLSIWDCGAVAGEGTAKRRVRMVDAESRNCSGVAATLRN